VIFIRYAKEPFEMTKKMLRGRWLDFVIYLTLALLIVVEVYYHESKTDWINDAILALTACVVLWYARETSMMKREVAKQNFLQTRPILILELRDHRPFLNNEGRGPALNASIDEFSVSDGSKLRNEIFEFNLPVFISPDSKHELGMYRKNKNSAIKGTVTEPDVLFQIGISINITLRYQDIEGAIYKTHMKIASGMAKGISFEPLSRPN
jgi:hypothetical protein